MGRRGGAGLLAALIIALSSCADSDGDTHTPVTEGFPLYGPGPHWIDDVRAGTVTFDAIASVTVDLDGDGGGDLTFELEGATTVYRSDAQDDAPPGTALHGPRLDLEIIDLTLAAQGISFRAGDGVGNFAADGPLFSLGSSEEIARRPELAHDDFAIFFAGTIGDLALHNVEPLRMLANIDRLPPIGNVFEMSGPPLPLFDAAGEPSAVQLVAVTYMPIVRP
jgi:hypothetical protein